MVEKKSNYNQVQKLIKKQQGKIETCRNKIKKEKETLLRLEDELKAYENQLKEHEKENLLSVIDKLGISLKEAENLIKMQCKDNTQEKKEKVNNKNE